MPINSADADLQLVQRTVAGDDKAYELLVIKYQRRIERLIGRMVRDVDLIRHAYVHPASQRRGVGAELLRHLRAASDRRMLVGTWAAAGWAIAFYERHGFAVAAEVTTPDGAATIRPMIRPPR